jgi:hypothetical protein
MPQKIATAQPTMGSKKARSLLCGSDSNTTNATARPVPHRTNV